MRRSRRQAKDVVESGATVSSPKHRTHSAARLGLGKQGIMNTSNTALNEEPAMKRQKLDMKSNRVTDVKHEKFGLSLRSADCQNQLVGQVLRSTSPKKVSKVTKVKVKASKSPLKFETDVTYTSDPASLAKIKLDFKGTDQQTGIELELEAEGSQPADDSNSKENIKLENSQSETDSDNDEDESFSYLKIREQNMKANEEFFASLGMDKAKEMLQHSTGKKKIAPTQRGLKIKREPPEPLPRRQSLRIRRIDPMGNQLPDPEPVAEPTVEERLPSGPIAMQECAYSKTEEVTQDYVKAVVSLVCEQKQKPEAKVSTSFDSFVSALEKVSITENRVAKVVPGRVFSLTWHPSPQTLIAVAGDKYGHIGLWNVSASEIDGEDMVRAFRPHIKPVSDLLIPPSAPHKLYSSSYDATLRVADFECEVFDEVFSVPEENDDLFRNFDFVDGLNTLLVSQFSGNVSLVDTRTPTTSAEHVYQVSKKSLRTVSVHPSQRHYFITAGVDTKINLWDLRSMGTKSPKPLQQLDQHIRAISSAYFSPDGHKVLSSAADDTICLLSVGDGMKLELSKRVRHNNHTGRWLTKFQPSWHPIVDDVFVSGSMARPREIQVFNASGSVVKALTDEDYLGSVCSLNAFHPNKICTLVGANSSGRLHVFM